MEELNYNIPQGHLSAMTPEQMQAYRWEREIDERNRWDSVASFGQI